MAELAKTAADVANESANGLIGVYEKMDREAHRERAKALIDGSRLIAAAPDLLAALQALIKFAKPFGVFRDDMGQGVENYCNEVIAKAEAQ